MKISNLKLACYCILIALAIVNTSAWAWGRRGHAIVCASGAYLVTGEKGASFLKEHSFDLSYYCNVPDFTWKEPATFAQESFNHYINIEIFERAVHGSTIQKPYELNRLDFEKAFPSIPRSAGRAWWRVRELNDLLLHDRETLMRDDLSKDKRFEAQGDWLEHAGIMGHYIGDLSMPLHVTENHDGKLTDQKGIHSFFEDLMVNDLFHHNGFDLESAAYSNAEKRWKKDHAKLAKMSEQELLEAESNESLKDAGQVLALDRKIGRKNLNKAMDAYRPVLVESLARGAVFYAEHLRRALGFEFDGNKFYVWRGRPDWIPFPGAGPTAAKADKP